ncbi:putative phosphatidate phosphatase isoform X2 [Argiope bruennichi]|uniref:Putative phosphatidate phosphatase like protein n=2 Tax=Argiope bruennichi TaxID=94029 RepID=A0A8T0FX66_ARGBR|nr:putative phosphatidate phosphatase isoform X2 [Argiope bruennichi]XP_055924264.1 putative phosphatidate phosphatase isoform X2 [Argiope bruennichi]XP_055924265.1 putative phosphatidate phosphatase isoform X2 [Argiope bruennichi]XP_055924266.1 putative phosphatidate phosphatase isoform X2 [Argiope bruennichi]KAF8794835.1 putative phosphatidate phosphatase like protein [Argiope bruennichi]
MISSKAEEKISTRIIIDVVLLIIAAIPIPLFYTGVFTPYQRGFFCDDETIRYPYRDSTVSDFSLYVGGLAIGILTIFLCEFVRKLFVKPEDESEFHIFGRRVPATALYIYASTSLFLFGCFIVEVATDFIKYTLGRLRPNFIDVCKPDFDCSSLTNPHKFVENYTCTNPDTYSVDDSRLSFPSGHSSFAIYAILFSVIYMQKCLICPHSKFVRPALQFILLLMGAYTAVSRIGDNKHHWSDVIAGSVLGVVSAVLMFYIPRNNLARSEEAKMKEGQKMSTNLELYGSI